MSRSKHTDVVIQLPGRDLSPSIKQVPEPAQVEAFITQSAMEALRVGVFSRLARADMQDIDLALDRPGKEMPTGQFRAVVNLTENGVASADAVPVPRQGSTRDEKKRTLNEFAKG
jgi:hypothetical protein